MPEFFMTQMGKMFFSGTMPSITRSLEKLSKPKTKEEEVDELAKKLFTENFRTGKMVNLTPAEAYQEAEDFIDYKHQLKNQSGS